MLCLIFISNSFAQTDDFICGTPDDFTPDPENVYSKSIDVNYLATFEPVVLNVFFWGINDDNGESTNKLTEQKALKAIATLNMKFNAYNIFFKYTGFDYINSTRFYIIHRFNEDSEGPNESSLSDFTIFLAQNPEYMKSDALNYHIPRSTIGFAGAGYKSQLRTVVNSFSFNDPNGRVVNHELGHVFNLDHTFLGWENENFCEHVTRDPEDPNFNADDKGDKVVDTAAMPDFLNERCRELDMPVNEVCPVELRYFYLNEGDCTYFNPNGFDCSDPPAPYQISTEDVRNLMAYTLGSCGFDLTTGQGVRMREYINDQPSLYAPITNTISSLYEPYKGDYYLAGPLPDDFKPALFQPGFSYMFKDCCCGYPQPSDFEDTSFTVGPHVVKFVDKTETVYESITHPNHAAFKILQLPTIVPEYRKCYDNWNKAPIGGTVIKFNDNVFNNNITLTQKDSTGINNPNLIQNLPSGLYKIEKNYEDGAIQESVIFKENN